MAFTLPFDQQNFEVNNIAFATPLLFFYFSYRYFVIFECSMLNFVKQLKVQHDLFLYYYIQGKDKTAEERRIAICIFDDVAEQCREAALK